MRIKRDKRGIRFLFIEIWLQTSINSSIPRLMHSMHKKIIYIIRYYE